MAIQIRLDSTLNLLGSSFIKAGILILKPLFKLLYVASFNSNQIEGF